MTPPAPALPLTDAQLLALVRDELDDTAAAHDVVIAAVIFRAVDKQATAGEVVLSSNCCPDHGCDAVIVCSAAEHLVITLGQRQMKIIDRLNSKK